MVDRLLGSIMGDSGDDMSEMLSGMSDLEDRLIGDESSGMVRVADQSGSWVVRIGLSSCFETGCVTAMFIYKRK